MTRKEPHVSPLRRSIRRKIEEEDPETEFEWDRYPLRFLVGKSIDNYISDPKFTLDAPDDNDILELAVRGLIFRTVHPTQLDIYEALKLCESPIERTMLGAMIILAVKEEVSLHFKSSPPSIFLGTASGYYPARHSTSILVITPQAQLGEYRVDFLLEYSATVTYYQPEARHPEERGFIIHPELSREITVTKDLIVECDGHDFHEKTKAQAARDKRRDRTLQSIGYNVFRFTGSEIYGNAISCAEEVFESINVATSKQIPLEYRNRDEIIERLEMIVTEIAIVETDESISDNKRSRRLARFQKLFREVEEDLERFDKENS